MMADETGLPCLKLNQSQRYEGFPKKGENGVNSQSFKPILPDPSFTNAPFSF